MSLATNVVRRNGRYSFRVRVPADLVARTGRIELIRALKTSNPMTARERAFGFGLRVHELWDAIRLMPTLTRVQIDDLVRRYFHEHLEQDQNWRIRDKPEVDWRSFKDLAEALTLASTEEEVDAAMAESGKHPRDFIQDYLTRITHACMKQALTINDWREAGSFVDRLISQSGVDVPRDSVEYRLLSQGVLRAVFEATRIILERSKGNWAAEPLDPLFKSSAPIPEPSTPAADSTVGKPCAEPLSVLVERFLVEKKGIAEKTTQDYRAAVRSLEEILGREKPIGSITRQQAASFKDALLEAPSNWTKRFPGKSLPEVIRLNKERGLPLLTAATINGKYLSPLSTFFRWAAANGLTDKNPFEGLRVQLPRGHKKAKKRLPFSIEHLTLVFQAPLFVGCRSDTNIAEPGPHVVRDHRFWAPLIGL